LFVIEVRFVAQPRYVPQLTSREVLVRFGVRVIILAAFAAFSSIGFTRGLATLMWMAIVFSSVVAIIRRERPFESDLNHWDESAAYAAMLSLISIFIHAAPA
jgi:hypothetical protein